MDISQVTAGQEGRAAGSQDGAAREARQPLLIVISGPSGVGKDLLVSRMREAHSCRHYAITATTRAAREGERDGVDYHFVSKGRFEEMIANGELLEWARVYGNYYGVPKAQVADALASGRDVVVKIDVQGAATIRGIAPGAVFVFLAPPSIAELERRLMGRRSEGAEALARRLAEAEREMDEAVKFDCVVVHKTNGTGEALGEVEAGVERARKGRGGSTFL